MEAIVCARKARNSNKFWRDIRGHWDPRKKQALGDLLRGQPNSFFPFVVVVAGFLFFFFFFFFSLSLAENSGLLTRASTVAATQSCQCV